MRIPALLILALLGLSAANASPPCQSMADKVTKEFAYMPLAKAVGDEAPKVCQK